MDIREELMAGASFEELAKTRSDDPSAQVNNGNLGYFSAFKMVYPSKTECLTRLSERFRNQ
ncbi:MAG: hypothetical protein HC896_02825 [Bacteroidales bacterium]|nr:hypothetical protein [Bacteroidales bacterium]